MDFDQLLRLCQKPKLYQSGSSLLWTDPHVSVELLRQQVNPNNNIGSRSQASNRRVVDWILSPVTHSGMVVLDLGCGPGNYAELLAERGHLVTGVDISRVSISYAKSSAGDKQLAIEYMYADYLNLDFENEFDLVILVFLNFSLLIPAERGRLLGVVHRALKKGGAFVFDVMNPRYAAEANHAQVMPNGWMLSPRGFWRPTPHLLLTASYHYPKDRVIANQYVLVEGDHNVESFIVWNRYYEEAELLPLLQQQGFELVESFDGLLARSDCWSGENVTFYRAWK